MGITKIGFSVPSVRFQAQGGHDASSTMHAVSREFAFDNICRLSESEESVAHQLFNVLKGADNHLPAETRAEFEAILPPKNGEATARLVQQIGDRKRPSFLHPLDQQAWDGVIVPRYFRILDLVLKLDKPA